MTLPLVLCLASRDARADAVMHGEIATCPGLTVQTIGSSLDGATSIANFASAWRGVSGVKSSRPLALVYRDETQATRARVLAWLHGIPICTLWTPQQTVQELGARLRSASPQAGLPFAVKRTFDLTISACALTALSPLAAVTALAVRLSVGSPILFSQERPGRHNRPFRIYKFRTMTDARAADGTLLPDEQRLTTVGRIVRSASMDELPQFWNVLRGEMSMIGPRPLLTQYLARYDAEQARRQNVLPGITGLAQVNGRNATSWPERLRLDVRYVDGWSLRLDASILAKTVATVLKREGISQPGQATMLEFQGESSHEAPSGAG